MTSSAIIVVGVAVAVVAVVVEINLLGSQLETHL